MADSDTSRGLEDREFTEQRNEALREGVRGLFLMNGGAAVAMLAFLQTIWKDQPLLAMNVAISIAVFAGGILLAGVVQFFRYHASFNLQSGKRGAFKIYRRLYLLAAYSSLATFLVGVVVVVSGALSALCLIIGINT